MQIAVDALNDGDISTPIEPRGSASQRKILRALEKLRMKTLEQQIAHARAIEQNKLAIASVAHDVKTPLALISGYAECLQDGMDDKDYLALISEKTEQLNGLVLKLVETSKHEIDDIDTLKEKVDTRTFLSGVLDKYETLAKTKNITYKVHRIPSAEIYADRRELERVFQNIISNAVKYTDEGGRIDVSFERNGRFFVVKVKDTGRGIDKKNLPYVFDKFYGRVVQDGLEKFRAGALRRAEHSAPSRRRDKGAFAQRQGLHVQREHTRTSRRNHSDAALRGYAERLESGVDCVFLLRYALAFAFYALFRDAARQHADYRRVLSGAVDIYVYVRHLERNPLQQNGRRDGLTNGENDV